MGGCGHTKYNYDEIVNYLLKNGNYISKTCQHFNIYDQVVYSALQSKNIDYKNLPKQEKNKYVNKIIHCIDLDLYFNSMKEIDDYFGKVVHPNIRRCLNGITKKAYGYKWEEIDKNE